MATTLEQRVPTEHEEYLAQRVFDYMKLNDKLEKADIIYVMGSIDTLPAERAADLFLDGWSNLPYLVFSGGVGGRNYEKAEEECKGLTEARMLADVAMKIGVSIGNILIEDKSQNSGQNIEFTKKLLEDWGIRPQSMIAVHMPSAERRDHATIKNYWPEIDVTMASPRVPFSEYHKRGYQGQMNRFQLISDLLGDFQKMLVFPRKDLGFGFVNPVDEFPPEEVKDAYHRLVARGYDDKHLLRFKDDHTKAGQIIPI